MPTRPAALEIQTRTISIPLGHNPKSGIALQELHFTGLCPKPCTISALLATPPRTAQPCKISALLGHAPKATNMHYLCSTGPWPQDQHSPAQYSLCKPMPLRLAKPGTAPPHTHTLISLLLDHTPQTSQAGDPQTHRISTPPACALQAHQAHAPKATTTPQLKASTHRPVGPHPLATCHRKAPNLPKRHTQTGLDAKNLVSEQLRLQFYCSRSSDFFPLL
jgi:hypothetical protein